MRARAVLIVALLFSVSIVASVAASTPVASPTADDPCITPWEWCDQPGYQSRVARVFEPAGSLHIFGPAYMLFGAATFDSPEHAAAALPAVLSALIDNFTDPDGQALDMSAVRPASVRSMGEQAIAYAGPFENVAGDETFDFAAVGVREGSTVYYGYGDGDWASPVQDLAGVLERVVGRDQATPTPGDNASPDGVPELADLPEGWVMTDEWVYR